MSTWPEEAVVSGEATPWELFAAAEGTVVYTVCLMAFLEADSGASARVIEWAGVDEVRHRAIQILVEERWGYPAAASVKTRNGFALVDLMRFVTAQGG